MRRHRIGPWGPTLVVMVFAATALQPVGVAAAAGRTPTWVRTFAPPNGAAATSVAVGPAGTTVYFGGATQAPPNLLLVRAYAAASGARRWVRSLPCSADGSDACWVGNVALSPDATTLFLTGTARTGPNALTWVTMALDSATGARRWVERLRGGYAGTTRLAVSPAGDRIFVAGSVGTTKAPAERVVAYDATTGAQTWRSSERGFADVPYLAVSPDGSLVFGPAVADRRPSRDIALTARDAATGAIAWRARTGAARIYDWPAGMTLGRAGNVVFLSDAREAFRDPIGRVPVTVALRARDGRRLWAKSEPALFGANAMALPIAAGGGRVVITDGDLTVARHGSTGRLQWVRRTSPSLPWWSYAWSVALSPRADRVFVSDGVCTEADLNHCWLRTIALRASTGGVRWTAHRGRAGGADLVVGPSGTRVYVAGWLGTRVYDYRGMLAIAYPT
jgi:outer membrane protein assembly factor BamB